MHVYAWSEANCSDKSMFGWSRWHCIWFLHHHNVPWSLITHAHTCTHAHTHTHACAHSCMHAYMYMCVCVCVCVGGHFICKVFDMFTPFSVGLFYLLYRCFEQVSIIKPVTSRPANSERSFFVPLSVKWFAWWRSVVLCFTVDREIFSVKTFFTITFNNENKTNRIFTMTIK